MMGIPSLWQPPELRPLPVEVKMSPLGQGYWTRVFRVSIIALLCITPLIEGLPVRKRLVRDLSEHMGLNEHGHRTQASHHPHYEMATKYLQEFGYLNSINPTPHDFRNALKTFQDLAGIERTGLLDIPTIEEMKQPRCGNTDISKRSERNRRFVFISKWENKIRDNVLRLKCERNRRLVFISKWENKIRDNVLRLKWFIQNYTKDIPRFDIKKTVKKAFQIWSSQAKIESMISVTLIFEEANSEADADITILWAEGDHGDAHKFDGPGSDGSNILAHTFYPNYQSKGTLNGDIHLDDFENWHINASKDGASFPHVLVHEIGHTLGLGHSKKQQAIMYPIYRKDSLDLMKLDLDDKCAISWTYVGASDFCLYIWLLSDVLPKKIAVEKDSNFMIDDNTVTWDSPAPTDKRSKEELVRSHLRNTPIPRCLDENNVQRHFEQMLVRRLNFPRELAQDYSEVFCRFFDGLHTEFKNPTTENFQDSIRINSVHNYFQDEKRFDKLEVPGFKDRTFDAPFFNWLISEFVK
uniref:Peptidase metallopeptidase domain-containing protein n=1 Tax=Acrobeloides nanus TaxID=290746 RepID=A0A914BX74_9BILA